MRLVVVIKCASCGAKKEVHVLGGWDLANVTHDCEGRQWEIAYNPPRGVF